MKKHLLFDYGCTLLVFLLTAFLALRTGLVSSAYFLNEHFTAAVAITEGVSEGNIRAHKVQRKFAP